MADNTSNPFPTTSIYPLVPVRDMAAAVEFYRTWMGRDADIVVEPTMQEWQLAPGMWLQVAEKRETAGTSVIRIGVDDVAVARTSLVERGLDVDEPVDYFGVVRVADFRDPDGNRFSLVQELT
ncbi:VOC family protein [Pseudonocardia zijingensis]|uniref:VOC family protein n=1 Tax=Pseudonocardia zijingensis TaxID=153376 RepID=A0ABP3YPY7_9PSEU